MSKQTLKILCVGATGSVGRLVVAEAIRQGHTVRAIVRSQARGRSLPTEVEIVVGDITEPDTLDVAVQDADAIVFTHGSDGEGKQGSRNVDYGGVRNVLQALGTSKPRIALMTAIGVTNRDGAHNRSTEAHDWKRRSERFVRAGGSLYTIVRPGWFDYNKANEHKLVFLQGDTRQAGNSSDGVIAREQIAQVLVSSLTSEEANRKTFELVAVAGAPQQDLAPLFAGLESDPPESFDGVSDVQNQPLTDEPASVLDDLRALAGETKAPR